MLVNISMLVQVAASWQELIALVCMIFDFKQVSCEGYRCLNNMFELCDLY